MKKHSSVLRAITVICIACIAVTGIIWAALSSQDWAALSPKKDAPQDDPIDDILKGWEE